MQEESTHRPKNKSEKKKLHITIIRDVKKAANYRSIFRRHVDSMQN